MFEEGEGKDWGGLWKREGVGFGSFFCLHLWCLNGFFFFDCFCLFRLDARLLLLRSVVGSMGQGIARRFFACEKPSDKSGRLKLAR